MTNEQDEKMRVHVLKSTAVRQALVEVMGEQRPEIIKRAVAKLAALGIVVTGDELGAQV